MNKKSTVIVAVLVVFAVIAFGRHRASQFPPIGVPCFDSFMSSVESGYADPALNLPPFELKNVSYFRCASAKGFEQYEVSGVDTSGHEFYVHHAGGGMAASGADSYLDHCYKKDGAIVKSSKVLGRGASEEGSCQFDTNFPTNPESTFEFRVKSSAVAYGIL